MTIRAKVLVFTIIGRDAPRAGGEFVVSAGSVDDLAAAARLRIESAGNVVRSIAHGPGGLVVYVQREAKP